jgi:outer membrane protein OmpA-like peptidoglycan-associated protein
MKKSISVLLSTFCVLFMLNRAEASSMVKTDTVVVVTGTVKNDENAPLKAIVDFKRLPYGNEIGRISSNDNGEFTIYVHGDASYSISVASEGYFAHYEEFNVNLELSNQGGITREIVLVAGAAGFVFTLENLIFQLGESEITSSSFSELDVLVARLKEFPQMEIQLEGHTDTRGNSDANMTLSQDRVIAVKAYLVNKDIQEMRIKTRAFGGTKPLSTEDTEEGHASNRRVEVRILKVE